MKASARAKAFVFFFFLLFFFLASTSMPLCKDESLGARLCACFAEAHRCILYDVYHTLYCVTMYFLSVLLYYYFVPYHT